MVDTVEQRETECATARDHSVVVFATPDDSHAIRDVLIEQLDMHPTDAQIHAHAVPGVLVDHLSAGAAARLADKIRQTGVNAAAMPRSDIPDLKHPQVLHHIRYDDREMKVVGVDGEIESRRPWTELELISVGYVPLEMSRHYIDDSMVVVHSSPRPAHEPIDVPSMSGPEAWLLWKPEFNDCCIDHNLMNYEGLGERMSESATNNFRILLSDIVRAAPSAYLTPATRAYLEHGLSRHFLFHSSEELQRHTSFHAMLLHQIERNAGRPKSSSVQER